MFPAYIPLSILKFLERDLDEVSRRERFPSLNFPLKNLLKYLDSQSLSLSTLPHAQFLFSLSRLGSDLEYTSALQWR